MNKNISPVKLSNILSEQKYSFEFSNGFFVKGRIKNNTNVFESFIYYRIAIAFGILSLLLNDGRKVNNFKCVGISDPNFINQLYNILR